MKPTAKQRQLQAEWEAMMKRHAKPLERGAVAKSVTVKANVSSKYYTPKPIDPPRGQQTFSSVVTPGGSTAKKEVNQYTGTEMLGIGQMPKSNAVPIFRQEDAVAIARMRRN